MAVNADYTCPAFVFNPKSMETTRCTFDFGHEGKHSFELQPVATPAAPPNQEMFSHTLIHLNGEFRKAGKLTEFITDGRVIVRTSDPELLWQAYRERVITDADYLRAHSWGITFGPKPVKVYVPQGAEEAPGVKEARDEYQKRFFSTYNLK